MAANITREHGNHKDHRARTALQLRHAAAEMSEEIADLTHSVCVRADREGWDDPLVERGCRWLDRLERDRAKLIAEAKAIGTAYVAG